MRASHDASDTKDRMLQLALRLFQGDEITSRWIHEEFNVSWATAKRDMARLQTNLPVHVTEIVRDGGYRSVTHVLKLLQPRRS